MSARRLDLVAADHWGVPARLVHDLVAACEALEAVVAQESGSLAFLRLREAAIAARDLDTACSRAMTSEPDPAMEQARAALRELIAHANAHVYTFMLRPPGRILEAGIAAARAAARCFGREPTPRAHNRLIGPEG